MLFYWFKGFQSLIDIQVPKNKFLQGPVVDETTGAKQFFALGEDQDRGDRKHQVFASKKGVLFNIDVMKV
jgi:hypothetical protein